MSSVLVNERNHLVFAGQDVVRLAEQFGTPLYIYDEELLRANARAYRNSLAETYPPAKGRIYYAAKAFFTQAMAQLIAQEGLGLDVVSGGELATALWAGVDPQDIIFNGNNKSVDEMTAALHYGVGRFVIDSLTEIEVLDDLAGRMRRRPDVLVRVNPGVEAHTHEYVQTGITDCKFGLGATDGMALAAVDSILASTNLQLAGFHCHIGSQIFELDAYRTAVNAMAAFIKQVNLATGYFPAELDLGGGLGIRYTDNDQKMEINVAVALMSSAVKQVFQDKGWELPYLILEPGRSIVGEAGLAVYRVGVVKNIPGARTYVAVDGGMSDNPRVALYNSQYEAVVANRVRSDLRQTVTIAGKCCESGDLLAKDIELGPVQRGDLVAVFSAGAYQYSMASNYNRIPRPAVVMANHAGADLIIKRETYADLLKSDIVPERFCARQEHVVGL